MTSISFLVPNVVADPKRSISVPELVNVTERVATKFSALSAGTQCLRSLKSSAKPDLSQEDAAKIDVDNIFYDIVFDKTKSKICAIGPGHHNARRSKKLRGFRIVFVGGGGDHFSPASVDTTSGRLSIAKSDNVPGFREFREIKEVYLVFGEIGELGPYTCTSIRESRGAGAVLLNKNNQVSWIVDWITHHYLMGVDFFAIYDNGSSNISELLSGLERIPFDIDVLFVSWPYPFGPQEAPNYKFAQPAMLQHATTIFPHSKMILNVDTDELVFADDLSNILEKASCGTNGLSDVIYFRRYDVVTSDEILLRRWPKFRAYEFSEAVFPARRKAQKYAAKPSSVRHAYVHTCTTHDDSRALCALDDLIVCLHYLPLTTGFQSKARKARGLPTKFEEVILKANGQALFKEDNSGIVKVRAARQILEVSRRLSRVARVLFFVPGLSGFLRQHFQRISAKHLRELRRELKSQV